MNIASCHIQLHRFARLERSSTPIPSLTDSIHRSYPQRFSLFAALHDARVTISGVTLDLLPGGCLLLPVEESVHWESVGEPSSRLVFEFSLHDDTDAKTQPIADMPLALGLPYHLPRQQFQQVLDLTSEVERHATTPIEYSQDDDSVSNAHTADRWMYTAQLQLILSMMLRIQRTPNTQETESSIHHVIRYMETHYDQPLSVEQLAERAGMVRWQFSERFKSLTGSKPTDYLNLIRVEQAKRLLDNHADLPLREVARRTGFSDEYYFSRRFRQTTGQAPRRYAEILARSRTRIIYDGLGRKVRLPDRLDRIVSSGSKTLGELLTLQMRPMAAGLTVIKHQVIFQRRLHGIADFGIQIDMDIAAQLQPQLHVLSFCTPELLEALSSIAPVIVIEGNHNSTYHRLRLIGQALERKQAVDTWIDTYEQTIRQARYRLADHYTMGEQSSVFLYLPSGLFVMGQNGLAATLYEMLGFIPPPAVRDLIAQQQCWRKISIEQLAHYASDRNFLLTSDDARHTPEAQAVWSALDDPSSPRHLLDASWNFDDPITRHRLAQELPQLLKR